VNTLLRMTTTAVGARTAIIALLLAAASLGAPASAQSSGSLDSAAQSTQQQLEQAIADLASLRRQIEEETVPMSRQLSDSEAQLSRLRAELQQLVRELDSRSLDVTNLGRQIKASEEETAYLSNLLDQFIRSFDSRLHIAELQRLRAPIEAARLAPENSNLTPQQVFDAQASILSLSLDRLFDSIAGSRFEGTAVDATGTIHPGTFVLVGPTAIFHARDGSMTGTAEQRLGSQEPSIVAFADPLAASAAASLATSGRGLLPLDPTLGNAHKVAEIEESLLEHIAKGGPVMIPIFALAALAVLIALWKSLGFLFVGRPSRRRMRSLLDAVARNDRPAALKAAKATGRPTNRMLLSGLEHMDEPRELVEEVMYESVLGTRLKLQRFLPFIAICAAAAPLLGLLGTVMGIIDTFRSITIFGAGDVKNLSGGISKALITTEYGLIVAIPSLLLHAILARRAKAIVDSMEVSGAAFLNELSRAQWRSERQQGGPSPSPRRGEGALEAPPPATAGLHSSALVGDQQPPRGSPAQGHAAGPTDGESEAQSAPMAVDSHRPVSAATTGRPPRELAPSAT